MLTGAVQEHCLHFNDSPPRQENASEEDPHRPAKRLPDRNRPHHREPQRRHYPVGKPWKAPTFSGGSFPRNFLTGKPYRGVNVFLLWGTRFNSPFWLTFKQVLELGGSVRKGEKGSQIVFYKQLLSRGNKNEDVPADKDGDRNTDRAPLILTCYTIFNVGQCEGLTIPNVEPTAVQPVHVDETCEAIVNGWATRPAIRTEVASEGRAYYRPSTNSRLGFGLSTPLTAMRPCFMDLYIAPDTRAA